jgi:opacity protein-like surface antigen
MGTGRNCGLEYKGNRKNSMKKSVIVAALVVLALGRMAARAGVEQGMNEVSILGDVHRITQEDDSFATFAVAATYNRYLLDNVSIGADLKYMAAMLSTAKDITAIYLMARSDYCFMPESDVVPYIGLRLGLVEYEIGDSDVVDKYTGTTFAYGGQAGVKWFAVENMSLNLELSYTAFTLPDSGETDDQMGDLGVLIGASVYF